MCIFSREVSFLWTATSWFLLSNLFFQPAPWLSLFKITTVGFLGALSRAYRGTLFMFAPMLPALVLPCSLVPSSSQISSLCFHHRQTDTHTSISVKSRFYIWQNTCDFYFSRFGLTLLNGIRASIFNYIWVCVCVWVHLHRCGDEKTTLCSQVVSFHHVGSRDWTQIIRLGDKCVKPSPAPDSVFNV